MTNFYMFGFIINELILRFLKREKLKYEKNFYLFSGRLLFIAQQL